METLGGWYFDSDRVKKMAGLSFRPVLRFYNVPAYEDLYLRLNIQSGLKVLWEGESVYVDPDYGYVLFPPIQIPPNKLLNETQPHPLDLILYGLHETDAAYTIDFDCLTLLPLEPGANFLAFYEIYEDGRLLDDNFLNRHSAHFDSNDEEVVAHIRQGSPLTLFPGHYQRLFVLLVDEIMRWTSSGRSIYGCITGPENGFFDEGGRMTNKNDSDVFTTEILERDFTQPVPLRLPVRPIHLTWSGFGGPEKAELLVVGPKDELLDLVNLLRCGVTVRDGQGEPVWWGYIEEVQVELEKVEVRVSLEDLANRVSVQYEYTSPDTLPGDRNLTDVAEGPPLTGGFWDQDKIAAKDQH